MMCIYIYIMYTLSLYVPARRHESSRPRAQTLASIVTNNSNNQ